MYNAMQLPETLPSQLQESSILQSEMRLQISTNARTKGNSQTISLACKNRGMYQMRKRVPRSQRLQKPKTKILLKGMLGNSFWKTSLEKQKTDTCIACANKKMAQDDLQSGQRKMRAMRFRLSARGRSHSASFAKTRFNSQRRQWANTLPRMPQANRHLRSESQIAADRK
jgi:hypothetical protein